MGHFGLNFGYLMVMLINLLFIAGWLALSIVTLFRLKRSALPPTAAALWAILIVFAPFLGAIAFWIVQPQVG